MRIAVMGTGGVGGYFGAKLALARQRRDVRRARHGISPRCARDGLRVESESTPMHVRRREGDRRPGVDRPGRRRDVLRQAVGRRIGGAEAIRPLLGNGGVAIPFQNGIDAPGVLQRVLGAEHVIGGIAYIAATIASPGVIAPRRHDGAAARRRVRRRAQRRGRRVRRGVRRAAGVDIALAPDIRRGAVGEVRASCRRSRARRA